MTQATFDSYVLASSDAYVRLTRDLLLDIRAGKRMALLNGCLVTLREKILAVLFLKKYIQIFQEHTLTDIGDTNSSNEVVRNRMTRQEMRELVEAINLLTGLGMNASEDFVLDRN